MERRKILRSIGGATTGSFLLSGSALAEMGVSSKDSTPDKEAINQALESIPTQYAFKRLGLPNPDRYDVTELEWLGIETSEAEKTETTIEGETSITSYKFSSNIGDFVIMSSEGDFYRTIVGLDYENLSPSYLDWVARPGDSSTVQEQVVIGTKDSSEFVRGTSEREVEEIKRLVEEEEVEDSKYVVEDNKPVYKILTPDSRYVIDGSMNKIISHEMESVSTQATDCSTFDYAYCGYSILETSAYCGLAAYACTPSVLAGPAGVLACLAAMASVCGARIGLTWLTTPCPEVADCIIEWCRENPEACQSYGPITAPYP